MNREVAKHFAHAACGRDVLQVRGGPAEGVGRQPSRSKLPGDTLGGERRLNCRLQS